jgi:thioredoxin 1
MKQLLKFSASWCGPCQALSTTLKEQDDWGIEIKEIDIDDQLDLAAKYGIRSVPTLIIVEGDKEVKRMTGAQPKSKIVEFING